MSKKLEGEARRDALAVLEATGWAIVADRDAIRKTFKFKSFVEAWGWMTRMAIEAEKLNHHLTEEEMSILNPAREEVGEQVRAELGEAFLTERNRLLDEGCGSLEQVRRLVTEARRDGLLDEDD